MPIIASNFKTNHTRKSTSLFIEKLNNYLQSNDIKDEVYVFPTSTSLDSFNTVSNLLLGVQNAYPAKNGSFTGEIGLEQLEEFDIKTILIGHSERRHILGETQEEIAKKYEFYKNLGFRIIYCIGEPLEIKNAGLEKTLEYIYEQFIDIDTNYSNLILAYEPVWAIGTGVTATNDDIGSVHKAIKEKINKPLLYGGSVKVENVKEICKIENVDGALIGTASWKIEDFIKIIENTKDLK
ncbi:triose-phosphate isomerase [Aliarcobacter cibarius]|jgi:triosephosphate isomerase (TIM)|uniref:Triosephosphate isomerase n=1 Tax=Aliarcobacter cibarius TaxID=255507 RepID=A0A5J6RF24_9BACT|nr:triose-phosphate isomerase [Aliarcobacter cibarius]QEZ88395.1 triosephosphate isomerase [Aliarcobacter cibarius]QKJ26405.1 triosephosphate isomerase [Aliarcobacter cibarius]TLT01893.1 triose-phosphate isomerase [Aliarcobacter cibarius]TLT02228.1 triose-phosphate isomerase [Aliarcobacter cibarius]TLT04659.1 triose-phosphate isomerase [Aliarcobacter cibarius]